MWAWENTSQANWLLFGALGVLLVLPVFRSLLSGSGRRDPKRAFDFDERRVGFSRAGNRCEMSNLLGMRCHRSAQHADHWLPWSKGGRSSMANLVAACAKHNLAKSNRWPTWWQTTWIALRCRGYFPAGYALRPGEKY